jgi:hypothetical protein
MPNFRKVILFLTKALLAPLPVLRLADKKVAAMDKLYFHVCKTDAMVDARITVMDSGESAAGFLVTCV